MLRIDSEDGFNHFIAWKNIVSISLGFEDSNFVSLNIDGALETINITESERTAVLKRITDRL